MAGEAMPDAATVLGALPAIMSITGPRATHDYRVRNA